MSKPVILVVEDNPQILYNLRLILDLNDYESVTATNGLEALEMLEEGATTPDLIISDIMMPKMDGYDFYTRVSRDPRWQLIPFVFLSAKSAPEDVRFGKMLGVDDYLTKPFVEEDLLACIVGKLKKSGRDRTLRHHLEADLAELGGGPKIPEPGDPGTAVDSIHLIWVAWDDVAGPVLKEHYPPDSLPEFSLKGVGEQLFNASVSLYGFGGFSEPEGILLPLTNVNRDGYILFDAKKDGKSRGKREIFMVGVLAPRIDYLKSLRIKEELGAVARLIREENTTALAESWERIKSFFPARGEE